MDEHKQLTASVLQIVGALSLVAAGFVLGGLGAAFVVAGVLALVFGIALERELVPPVAVDEVPADGGDA